LNLEKMCCLEQITTPVPSLKEGGELEGYGCTTRIHKVQIVSHSAGPMGTAPLLFARRGRGWFFFNVLSIK
jgi:hypothetical protein